jgi:hypothetical protein
MIGCCEQEVSIFSASDDEALEACVNIVRKLHEAKQFTDTAGFSLKCLVCGKGLTGAQVSITHIVLLSSGPPYVYIWMHLYYDCV